MVDDGEIALRLVLTMIAHALVDGRKVVEHLIGTIDIGLEMAEDVVDLVGGHPERGDVVARVLDGEDCVAEDCFEVVMMGFVEGIS